VSSHSTYRHPSAPLHDNDHDEINRFYANWNEHYSTARVRNIIHHPLDRQGKWYTQSVPFISSRQTTFTAWSHHHLLTTTESINIHTTSPTTEVTFLRGWSCTLEKHSSTAYPLEHIPHPSLTSLDPLRSDSSSNTLGTAPNYIPTFHNKLLKVIVPISESGKGCAWLSVDPGSRPTLLGRSWINKRRVYR
jgi:hypothetical protein